MGAVHSYMLYFRKDQLEDVLRGVADAAEQHAPPALLHFPS